MSDFDRKICPLRSRPNSVAHCVRDDCQWWTNIPVRSRDGKIRSDIENCAIVLMAIKNQDGEILD